MRLLVVEDEPRISELIKAALERAEFVVDTVRVRADAREALANTPYDAAILDLGLPDGDGLELLAELRPAGNHIPILIITARDAVEHRVLGLDAGADDYLVKPFALAELAARMRALLRRQHGRAEPLLVYGDLTLNPATHQVMWRGAEVALASREFAVLQALLERPGVILSRAQLEERLYGWNEEVASNAIEVHIHHLRQKLEPALIRTVRGIGYMVLKIA